MEAAPAPAAVRFAADLCLASDIASRANVSKTRRAKDSAFEHWCAFCRSLQVSPLLDGLDDDSRASMLLVYGLRYRQTGRTGDPVRAKTVDDALLAVGQGITNLGGRDPRKQADGITTVPALRAFIQALRNDDEPSKRAYPINVAILRRLPEVLDTEHREFGTLNAHVIDLIIVAVVNENGLNIEVGQCGSQPIQQRLNVFGFVTCRYDDGDLRG